jgi:steroid 5-alpha reductase family enzyme
MNFELPALAILIYMHLLFVLALWRRDNSIVDIGWGLGFVGVAWVLWLAEPHPSAWLLLIPVSLWGLRLAIYLYIRNTRSGQEDWRYAEWRRDWGRWVYLRAYFQVFLFQGLFMWIISLPLMGSSDRLVFGWPQVLGFIIWAWGFLWEAVADYQLFVFKRRPKNKGKLMDQGLWGLSRHPNYFGEMLVWWGIFLIATGWVTWWIAIISPLTISLLLWKVSGVPMLEKKYAGRPAYQAYRKTTPALLPDLRKLF